LPAGNRFGCRAPYRIADVNNTVTRNGVGMEQFSCGVFESRGNNTIRGNTTETAGTITTFGPM